MSSHKKNPPAVSKSLQQEMGSEKTNAEADAKPFSIRQYALAWRNRSIFHSWPFPEKYLHMCLSRGIRDVLPPLFASQTCCEEDESSLKGCCSKNLISYHGNNSNDDSNDGVDGEFCKTHSHSNIKNNNEYGTSFHDDDDDNQHKNCIVPFNNNVAEEDDDEEVLDIQPISSSIVDVHKTSSSPTMLASLSNKGVKDKRRRRRGRCKKRSMADILADARYCTVEEIYSMNKFYYAAAAIEGSHQQQQMGPYSENDKVKNGSEDDYDDEEGNNNNDLSGKGTLLLKFKLNACNVNRKCVT
ncbi:hypothetical protein PIB30_052504 [Stylosanthes scabra]|uniref:Uncharacterized protein n=1 Tax=Stylosanthes scabra TaxID=79078 RepID=A0ABU6WGB7_9FABA|nr:hypothetical protein [Stylosanthes scabra]